jgi:hypothetical protein
MNNLRSAVSLLKSNSRFRVLNDYVLYRKAKFMLLEGDRETGLRILKNLVKSNSPFSDKAKDYLKILGEHI